MGDRHHVVIIGGGFGGLSPADIAAPLRAVLKNQANARVRLGEVSGIDAARRRGRSGWEG
jgi:NADH dehydrogenase FAD-containing subunit